MTLAQAATTTLLPTPVVNDMGAGYSVPGYDAWQAKWNDDGSDASSLSIAVRRLLDENGDDELFPARMVAAGGLDRFGRFGPAIGHWEDVLGRRAPAPTAPTGRGGKAQLSPRFVEFLMGLPDGWVTGTATSRDEQLKALGNGVVPQQAAAAIRYLLAVREALT